jgi:hypothetical protein
VRFTWLYGIDCPAPTACVAVGTAGPALGASLGKAIRHGLVETCTGRKCSLANLPKPDGDVSLRSVSCPAPDRCVAVGLATTSAFTVPPLSTLPPPRPRPYALVERPSAGRRPALPR